MFEKLGTPKTLPYEGRTINYGGPGRTPGGHLYLDILTGKVLELFFAQVETVGPVFCMAAVAGNPTLGRIRVDNAALLQRAPVVGDTLLAGPLDFSSAGVKAQAAWYRQPQPAKSKPPTAFAVPPVPVVSNREQGIVKAIKSEKFGFIASLNGGADLFFHASDLQAGMEVRVGARVSYVRAMNEKGPIARQIRPAA